jgi:hypothetical protein
VAKPGYSWRLQVVLLRASNGGRNAGLVGGRRFGLGKRRHWRAVCGTGSWFRQKPARPTEGRVGRAARQGASGVWSTASCKAEQAECEERRKQTVRATVRTAAGRKWAPAGASGAKRGATRGRKAPVVFRRLRRRRTVPAPAKQPAKWGGHGSGGRQGASPVLGSVGSPGCS